MSLPTLYLPYALEDGLAAIISDGKTEQLHYYQQLGVPAVFKAKWANPEEKVCVELWSGLIYKYGYPLELDTVFGTGPYVSEARHWPRCRGTARRHPQADIVAEAQRRRTQARALRQEAEADWQAAKAAFEAVAERVNITVDYCYC